MSQTEVQLIKDAVIVNADISNSAAIDVSKISGALPAAGGTITGDVTFDGETAGRDIVFDRSANALEFADNAKAMFGASDDLRIYHSGTHSFIQDTGSGNLEISSSKVALNNAANNANMATFTDGGAANLYHNGTLELATTSNGIDVFSDNAIVNIVSSDSGTSTAFIQFRGYRTVADVGRLGEMQFINQRDGDVQAEIEVIANGDTNSYFDFKTSNAGLRTLRVDHTGANFPDNIKTLFGAGNDLQIYHDGTDSIITNSTGDLQITDTSDDITITAADDIRLRPQGGENGINVVGNGAVELYHDNSKKLETQSTGVTITGVCTATSFSGSGANLTDVDAGATGGGSDKIFYENGQTVTTNYTIGDTFGAACNAMAAGPITINSGVTVTVNSGETLTII